MDIQGYAKAVVDEALRSVGGEAEFLCLTGYSRRKCLHLAAESIRYQYQEEYDAAALLSTAFQVYRGEDNLVDIGKALNESEEVRVGMAIQRAIGRYVRDITQKKGSGEPVIVTTMNGKHAKAAEATLPKHGVTQTPNLFLITLPEQDEIVGESAEDKPVVAKPAKVERSRERMPLLDAYRNMAETVAILPTDDAVAALTGCHLSTPGKCRERLRNDEGYQFERVDLPEGPNGKRRYHLWKVTVKGSALQAAKEAEARRAAEEEQRKLEAQRQETLQVLAEKVSTFSADQLAQLAALLK